METKIIEVTNGEQNWGKFLLMRFTATEWNMRSAVSGAGLLLWNIGWNKHQIWVLDLQTCEGAAFLPGGCARADLDKHAVWVCPLYEPFLNWLYTQDLADLSLLPNLINLPGAPFAISGYR